MKTKFFILLILLFSLKTNAQFNYPYEFGFFEGAKSYGMCMSPEDSIILTIKSNINHPNILNSFMIKFNQNGDLSSKQIIPNLLSFNGKFNYAGYGDYYINYGAFKSGNQYSFALIKTNSKGQIIWAREYGDTSSTYTQNVTNCADSGFIASYVNPFSFDSTTLKIIKVDKNGQLIWKKSFKDTSLIFYSPYHTALNDSTIVIAFNSYSKSTYVRRTHLHKFNINSLSLIDSVSFFISNTDWLSVTCLIKSDNKFLYMTRNDQVYKFDLNLNKIWNKTYGATSSGSYADFYKIIQLNDGNFVAVGKNAYLSSNGFSSDTYIVKLNANGDTIWTKHFGRYGFETAYDVLETRHNGLAICGAVHTYDEVFDPSSAYFILLNSDGEFSTGINNVSAEKDVKIFPNPTSEIINIQSNSTGIIEIRNQNGSLVYKAEVQESNSKININKLASGVYILRFISNENIEVMKFIKR